MPFTSGTFNPLHDFTDDAASATYKKVSSSRVDATLVDIADGLSKCMLKDGTQLPTANIPMNSKKFTGAADAAALQEFLTYNQVRNGSPNYLGTTGGSANAYTLTPSVALTAYVAGQIFAFLPHVTNTDASTLDISGLGVKNLFVNGAALQPAHLIAGRPYFALYDGTQFVILNPSRPAPKSFTAALIGTTTDPTYSTTLNSCFYRRFENTIRGTVRLILTGVTGGSGTARLRLTGLPAVLSGTQYTGPALVSFRDGTALSGAASMGAYVLAGTDPAEIVLAKAVAGGTTGIEVSECGSDPNLFLAFEYEAA